MNDEEFLAVVQKDAPGLTLAPGARWSNEVPCPKCGGTTRFQFAASTNKYRARVFCRHCLPHGADYHEYMQWMHGITVAEEEQAASRQVPEEKCADTNTLQKAHIVEHWHHVLGAKREYFRRRGISDRLIDLHRLGWNYRQHRYSIPCFSAEGVLKGVQYRAGEAWQKPKYISERGGVHKCLFNELVCVEDPPYIVIVEGPLDALALTSLGFPTVAPFSGGNTGRAWDEKWNRLLKAERVIIVADNDPSGVGELIAESRRVGIGRGKILKPPTGKDAGEFIQSCSGHEREEIERWLGVPPIGGKR